jgi:hypothetical protein
MPDFSWYWHRLRAMGPGEVAQHVRKKIRQAADSKRTSWPEVNLDCSEAFPKLPKPEDAPVVLREALKRDAENILAGRWKFFGHLELQVDDPPKWQYDYLVRRDVETTTSGFKLDYRTLGDGVDSKVIWEPSRWHQLVRLAMAAYVLGDRRAEEKCVDWLEDWVKHNPPYRGWNWTSALEVGMRLVQFTWIDALLVGSRQGHEAPISRCEAKTFDQSPPMEKRLDGLRRAILPPHVWYAWRHKSFGSSANNHLLGELAGCIVATVRWPGLVVCGASVELLQRLWERQVLEQFAIDGGNKEQALNYQLFSWEFCWQAMHAFSAGSRTVAPEAYLRLLQAGDFFVKVQHGMESWDYGDSDNAFVTPLFCDDSHAAWEWWNWMVDRQEKSVAIDYWLKEIRSDFRRRLGGSFVEERVATAQRWQACYHSRKGAVAKVGEDWYHFPESGQCVARVGFWNLRWDLSPLGYLATAAHGHLDALHLSIWWKGVALVIDPGTGAYHADKRVRNWLASGAAHNGPCPKGATEPRRLGPFLWSSHHPVPIVTRDDPSVTGILNLTGFQVRRTVSHSPASLSWKVEDCCVRKDGRATPFTVRWQFAPGSWVKGLGERKFSVHRADVAVVIEVDEKWAEVELGEPVGVGDQSPLVTAPTVSLEGIVSPGFRRICRAPYLKLVARPQGDKPCVFTTTFLASADS